MKSVLLDDTFRRANSRIVPIRGVDGLMRSSGAYHNVCRSRRQESSPIRAEQDFVTVPPNDIGEPMKAAPDGVVGLAYTVEEVVWTRGRYLFP